MKDADPIDHCLIVSRIGDPGSPERHTLETLTTVVIDPVAKKLGLAVKAPHLIAEAGSVSDQIVAALLTDRLVVADLTGLNANVMYEVAIRDAAGRPIVTIAAEGTRIPVTSTADRTIYYLADEAGLVSLQARLEDAARAAIRTRWPKAAVHWWAQRAHLRNAVGPPGAYPRGERESLTLRVRTPQEQAGFDRIVEHISTQPLHGYVVVTLKQDGNRNVAWTGPTTADALAADASSTHHLEVVSGVENTVGRRTVAPRNRCLVVGAIGGLGSPERRAFEILVHQVVEPIARELDMDVETPLDMTDMPEGGAVTPQLAESLCADDLMIVDLTGLSPFVMYALGIRHSAWLPALLIAREGTKNPFDIGIERTFAYRNDDAGLESLRRWLQAASRAAGAGAQNPVRQAATTMRSRKGMGPPDPAPDEQRSAVTFLIRTPQDEDAVAELGLNVARAQFNVFDDSKQRRLGHVVVTERGDGNQTMTWTGGIMARSVVAEAEREYQLKAIDEAGDQ